MAVVQLEKWKVNGTMNNFNFKQHFHTHYTMQIYY